MLASQNELRSVPSSYFLDEILSNCYYFSLKCLAEFTVKPSGLGDIFFKKVINYGFNFFRGLSKLSTSYWLSFGNLWL